MQHDHPQVDDVIRAVKKKGAGRTRFEGQAPPENHLHPTHYDILARCGARMESFVRAAAKGYKLCPECGQPILKKGQQRKHPDDYRHARGCPNAD
jgi:hypothetical protein